MFIGIKGHVMTTNKYLLGRRVQGMVPNTPQEFIPGCRGCWEQYDHLLASPHHHRPGGAKQMEGEGGVSGAAGQSLEPTPALHAFRRPGAAPRPSPQPPQLPSWGSLEFKAPRLGSPSGVTSFRDASINTITLSSSTWVTCTGSLCSV